MAKKSEVQKMLDVLQSGIEETNYLQGLGGREQRRISSLVTRCGVLVEPKRDHMIGMYWRCFAYGKIPGTDVVGSYVENPDLSIAYIRQRNRVIDVQGDAKELRVLSPYSQEQSPLGICF